MPSLLVAFLAAGLIGPALVRPAAAQQTRRVQVGVVATRVDFGEIYRGDLAVGGSFDAGGGNYSDVPVALRATTVYGLTVDAAVGRPGWTAYAHAARGSTTATAAQSRSGSSFESAGSADVTTVGAGARRRLGARLLGGEPDMAVGAEYARLAYERVSFDFYPIGLYPISAPPPPRVGREAHARMAGARASLGLTFRFAPRLAARGELGALVGRVSAEAPEIPASPTDVRRARRTVAVPQAGVALALGL